MNPSIRSQGLDHCMWPAISHAVVDPASIAARILGKPVLVVGLQLVQPSPQIDEPMLVRRKDLVGLVRLQLVERPQEVPEWVVTRLRMQRDVGGDPRQHVVAREHQAIGRLPEAQMPR